MPKHTYCPDCGARDDQEHYRECEYIVKLREFYLLIDRKINAREQLSPEEHQIYKSIDVFLNDPNR